MPGLTDLPTLLTSMQPTLREGAFVFLSMPGAAYGEGEALAPVASFAEDEGLTLVVPKDQADTHGHTYDGVFRAITLHVHSSLA
ncbi:MAG: ACT domain-containing protein, partial [Bacteroidota bacterium]